MTLRLYISDGFHITNPSKRIDSIEANVGEVDVVFQESVKSDPPEASTIVRNLLFLPLLLLTIYFHISVAYIWSSLTGKDDTRIVDYFRNTHGAKVVPIDENFHRLLSESRWMWSVGQVIVLLLAFLAEPRFSSEVFPYLPHVLSWFLLLLATGLSVFVFFLAGTLGARDIKMARDIQEYAGSGNDTTGVLIIGAAHASGIKDELSDNPEVEVVEE